MRSRSSGIYVIFPAIISGLTILLISVGMWFWHDIKHDIYDELTNAANLLERYYSITFKQRELSLLSIGQRLSEIQGEGQEEERLRIANQALNFYEDLSAIGFADTTGQILTLTGVQVGDSLPNLGRMPATQRSFQEAKNSDGMVIGEVYYFETVNDWIIPIRVPIRNSSGDLLALNTSAVIYEKMVSNLKSFGFPGYFSVQLINDRFGTTQLYFPLEKELYGEVLQRGKTLLNNIEDYTIDSELRGFTAFDVWKNYPVLGVQSSPTKFNHYVIVTVPANLIQGRFWAYFQYIMLTYFLLLGIVILAFWHFSVTEENYTGALQAERDYSNLIIKSSPAMIVCLDPDMKCTFINPITELALGYRRDELIGQKWWEKVLTEEDLRKHQKQLSSLDTIFLEDEVMKCIGKSNQSYTVNWSSVNIYNKKNELEEIFLFGNDQTEKEQATSKLKEREANLFTLIESTNSIIGLFDTKKRLVIFNQAFEQYAKATTDIELSSGMTIVDKMDEPYRTIFHGFLDRSLAGEKIRETLEYKGDGFKYFFLFNYHPIYQDDAITGVSMFVENITELKESQDQLQKYSEDLEGLVSERTLQIDEAYKKVTETNKQLNKTLNELKETQNQLIQTEKMASLGILTAGIGHEINNPLNFIKNGVIGLTDLIQSNKNPDRDTLDNYLHIIDEGVNRASEIVKSLSQYSRRGDVLNESCDITEIIENSLTILQNQLKNKVTIERNFQHGNVLVKGSSSKLHQALVNIISNAEQAIDEKGTIHIETEAIRGFLNITVKDDGAGISARHINRISDPFFTTKDPGKGTGLGLYITYSIIEEHNGKISVTSEKNQGTIFTIELPSEQSTSTK